MKTCFLENEIFEKYHLHVGEEEESLQLSKSFNFDLHVGRSDLEIFILPHSQIWSNWTLMFLIVTGQCYKTCSKMLLI